MFKRAAVNSGDSVIEVKKAVEIALAFVRDLYSTADVRRVTLEEVYLSDDGRHWYVTVGLQKAPDALDRITGKGGVEYKVVKVLASTGDVRGMTVREP